MYKCNGNIPKISTEKLEEIKKLNKIKKKIIPLKHCGFDCNYCKKTIPYTNKFIMNLNKEIKEQKIEKQIQLNKINKNIGQKLENNNHKEIGQILEKNYQSDNKKIKEQIQHQNIKSINRYDFKINKVKGEGNCLLKAILKSVGLEESHHKNFSEALINICKETNFDDLILNDYGFNNKEKLIEYVRTERNNLGIDTLSLILEKYNICFYIWHDNKINGEKWIIINKKKEENQPTIFLNYKDYKDKFPDNLEIAEINARYDALISEKYQNENTKNILKQLIDNSIEKRKITPENKTEVKILIWNVNSIRDFTVKSFFIQTLYENNIDIAMLQETMLKQDDKFYIKKF